LAMRCSSAGLFLVSSCARAPDDSLRVTERSKHALAETLRLDCAMDEYDAGARSDAGDPMRNEDQPRLVLSPQRMKRALLAEAAGSRCPTRQRARGWLADGKKERNGLFEGWSVGPSGAALRVSNAERWAAREPDELRIECGVGWCLDPWRPLTVQRAEWRSVQVAGALVDPAGPRTGSVQGVPLVARRPAGCRQQPKGKQTAQLQANEPTPVRPEMESGEAGDGSSKNIGGRRAAFIRLCRGSLVFKVSPALHLIRCCLAYLHAVAATE